MHQERYEAEHHSTHRHWVDSMIQRFGRINALMNNAGIALTVRVEADNDADLGRLSAVNLKVPLQIIRKALPLLRKSGHGRVVSIA